MGFIKKKGYLLSSILIILSALVFCVLDWTLVLNFCLHPITNFLFVLFIGFGFLTLILAVKNKSPWFFFVSAIFLGLSAFYVSIFYVVYWVSIIITISLLAVFVILSLIICGSKTEDIALNKSPDYKNYQQRKEEKAILESEKPQEDIPVIKSFKD